MRSEINPQADAFIESQPLFLLGYKANLKKIPLSVKHNRLDAMLANEAGQPCPNCTVTINEFTKDGRTFKAVSAITDITGNCTVLEFESGMRTVTVSGTTIQSQTFGPFQFENKKALNLVFVCMLAFKNLPESKEKTTKTNA